jgi:hypothetical protein
MQKDVNEALRIIKERLKAEEVGTQPTDKAIMKTPEVSVQWVRGRTSIKFNERRG